MRKEWASVILAWLLLTGCSTSEQQNTTPSSPASHGPVVEIPGVEPRYEPINPGTSRDYNVNGITYKIVQDPTNFSQSGLASWYGKELHGSRTALGEIFNADEFTAAHPTLPLPSYVRVTNLANGRQLVVRVNDRGPYTPGRVIDLSKAAADRLNISNQTRVRLDFIKVAPDGLLSGPGTIGTRVAKKSFALPARPDIGGAASTEVSQPAADNKAVTEKSQAPAPADTADSSLPSEKYLVQIGALSDKARAQRWLHSVSQRFGISGMVSQNGDIYRVQLGPFHTRAQAVSLQQRLASEIQQQSFISQTL